MKAIHVGAAALFALAFVPGARAAVDVEVRNGDKVAATISPATETETFRFRVPKGAVISVKAAAAKKPLQLRLVLKNPDGDVVGGPVEGKSATLSKKTADVSGLYSVEITSKDGVSVGDYAFSATWKSPTSFGGAKTLAAATPQSVEFAADDGAVATFAVKKAKNSDAAPTLVQWTAPSAAAEPLTGATQKRTLAATGDGSFSFSSPTAGDVTATVKLKPPKASARRYALTAKTIGGGDAEGDTAFSAIVGPAGGAIAFPTIPSDDPGSQLDGSGVQIPPGALPVGTAIVIATAPDIAATGGQAAAGTTVAFGPEGLEFGTKASPKSATVTIPFDLSYAGLQDQITVYTRDAKGVVAAVPKPYVFDLVARTVSFQTRHFSSFRAVSATAIAPGGPTMFTVATIAGANDVCEAHEPGPNPPRYKYFVASTSQREVLGLVPQAPPSLGYDVEVFAGGGAGTANGTPRLQYSFPALVAVTASAAGLVFVATANRIYKIDLNGAVSVYAGTGASGDTGDNGPAVSATFVSIRGLLAGNGLDLFIADAGSRRIRVINDDALIVRAYAGDGTSGVGVDGLPPASTQFLSPGHMAIAHAGGIYVADDARLRRLDPVSGANETISGDPSGTGLVQENDGTVAAARFSFIYGVSSYYDAASGQDLIAVTDSATNCVWSVDVANDKVVRIGGILNLAGDAADAPGPPAPVDFPIAVVRIGDGTVFVDSANGKVRGTSQ
jgi:hypothetical protein